MSENNNTIDFLRSLYFEILSGYSFVDDKNFYIKHLNDLENSQVIKKRFYFTEKYKKEGIPTFNEKLKEIISSDLWTLKDEDDILSLKYQISDNEKNLKTIIQYQKPLIQAVIDDKKRQLTNKLVERKQLIGKTSDDFALKESENYFIYLSLYKDSELKKRLYETYEDFEDLDEEEIENYSKIIEEKLSYFKEEYIYKIAVMPFFLNMLSYVKESIFHFYNKPISQLSPFQILLFSTGQRNLNILNQSEGSPPELIDQSIETIIEWYDKNYSILMSKNTKNLPQGITKTNTDVITKRY